MSAERRLEHDLPEILGDLARGRYPDYIDDVLASTAELRQDRAWTFPVAARLPWRAMAIVLVLIALLLAAVIALSLGTRTRLPAPYGLARNGLVAYDADGDIFTSDPVSGVATAIVTGKGLDLGPRFSLDGTHVVFERRLVSGSGQLYVARSDGTQLTLVTPEPILLTRTWLGEPVEAYQFSPDGRSILIASTEGRKTGISIARADGSGVTPLDVGMQASQPSYRPPDAAEILFVAAGAAGQGHGVFAVDPSTGVVRTIIAPSSDFDLSRATWSPDGARIAYWAWDTHQEVDISARTHVVLADGTGDHEIAKPADAVWDAGSDWSNDGQRLIVARGYTNGYEDIRAAVVPADGSSPGIEIRQLRRLVGSCCAAWLWSPDDTMVLMTPSGLVGDPLQQVLIDPVAGTSRDAPWQTTSDPAWQRLAR